jgi:hypothetical protein
MPFKKILLIVLYLWSNIGLWAQDEDDAVTVDIATVVGTHRFLGNNIYVTEHNPVNNYITLSFGVTLYDKWVLTYHTVNHKIDLQKNYYLRNNTLIKPRYLSLGYKIPIQERWYVTPSILYGFSNGKNDGKFDGRCYGGLLNVSYRFWRDAYLFAGGSYKYYDFDIQSTDALRPLYNHSRGLEFSGGLMYSF